MRTALEQLLERVPPPRARMAPDPEKTFSLVESRVGLTLPDDYRQLVLAYGDGCWQGFWYLLNPFSSNLNLNLLFHASILNADQGTLWAERTSRAVSPTSYRSPIWPEPDGIFPWAITDNGGRFFWLTNGQPSSWSTVYYPDRGPEFEKYDLSTSEIIWGAVSGALPIFAAEFEGSLHESAFAPITTGA